MATPSHAARRDRPKSGNEPVPFVAVPPVDDPRVYLAAERTFLAWVRTSVSLMGFGFVIARFALWIREYGRIEGLPNRDAAGCLVLAGLRHGLCRGVRLRHGGDPPPRVYPRSRNAASPTRPYTSGRR